MIDQETIDRIYAAVNIVDVIGDYATLKRKGVNYVACCPFHNEKTPSFVVSPAKGVYKCFGCGKGGNAVTFLMEHENMSYPEALKTIGKRYGIEVKERELSVEEVRRNDDRESMFMLNSWAADYFADYLHNNDEGISVGLPYFRQKRGFSEATIRKFGLGYCSASYHAMSEAALRAGYKEEFLLSTGLSIRSERDGGIFDRFHDRVIFPVHNISGRVVAFGGRILGTNKNVGKYLNSPESDIYSKKRELYGLYFAKRAIQQMDAAIMVEGYTDVISMHQAGVENVVSSSGTSLTTEQIRLLNRFTRNITVVYDGDAAGIHASIRGIDMILQEGMNVRVVSLPPEDDPDSFARSHTADQVQSYIRANEVDFITFKANTLMREASSDPIKRSAVIADMVQSITKIPDSIQRSVYVKECARIMEIDEQVLLSEVARKRALATGDRETEEFIRRLPQRMREEQLAERPGSDRLGSTRAGSGTEALERELLVYLLKYGDRMFELHDGRQRVECNVAEVILGDLEADGIGFENKVYNQLLQTYSACRKEFEGEAIPVNRFVNHPDPAVCDAAVDLMSVDEQYILSSIWQSRDIHVETAEELLSVGIPRAVMLYKKDIVAKMIAQLTERLSSAEKEDGGEESAESPAELLKRISQLNEIRMDLSKKLDRIV